ncbi:hypothetical protein HDE_01042 [Halotydeus destructor]|nr:hypothetical protein HDE_01042 [Halotydeus destructor]
MARQQESYGSLATLLLSTGSVGMRTYAGNKEEDAQEWLRSFDVAAMAGNWNDDAKFRKFRAALVGSAESWFQHHFKRQVGVTYIQLRAKFEKDFVPLNARGAFLDELSSKVQLTDQLFISYAYDVLDLCDRAGVTSFEAQRHYILKGAAARIKESLYSNSKIETIDQLIETGRHVDEAVAKGLGTGPDEKLEEVLSALNKLLAMVAREQKDGHRYKQQFSAGQGRLDSDRPGPQTDKTHSKRYPRWIAHLNRPPGSRHRPRRSGTSRLRCFICGDGHVARVCPNNEVGRLNGKPGESEDISRAGSKPTKSAVGPGSSVKRCLQASSSLTVPAKSRLILSVTGTPDLPKHCLACITGRNFGGLEVAEVDAQLLDGQTEIEVVNTTRHQMSISPGQILANVDHFAVEHESGCHQVINAVARGKEDVSRTKQDYAPGTKVNLWEGVSPGEKEIYERVKSRLASNRRVGNRVGSKSQTKPGNLWPVVNRDCFNRRTKRPVDSDWRPMIEKINKAQGSESFASVHRANNKIYGRAQTNDSGFHGQTARPRGLENKSALLNAGPILFSEKVLAGTSQPGKAPDSSSGPSYISCHTVFYEPNDRNCQMHDRSPDLLDEDVIDAKVVASTGRTEPDDCTGESTAPLFEKRDRKKLAFCPEVVAQEMQQIPGTEKELMSTNEICHLIAQKLARIFIKVKKRKLRPELSTAGESMTSGHVHN